MAVHKFSVLGNVSPSGYEEFFPDDITPTRLKAEIEKADGADIEIEVHSGGGFAEDGLAIYNMASALEQNVKFTVLGQAASAMSVFIMSGDEIQVSESAIIMIHEGWTMMGGGADDLRKAATYLEQLNARAGKIYADRTGTDLETVMELMKVETWMDSKQAVELGFAGSVIANKKRPDVNPSMQMYKNLPAELSAEIKALPEVLEARKRALKLQSRMQRQMKLHNVKNVNAKDILLTPKKSVDIN